MYFLPIGTPLGRLHLLEVWDYYDIPRLFVAQSASRTNYVAFWTAQTESVDEWLYAAVSDVRLEGIRSGQIPLRDVYTNPEDGFVFVVLTTRDGRSNVDAMLPDQVGEPRLPLEGDVVTLHISDTVIVDAAPSTHLASIRSVARGRNIPFDAVTEVLGLWRELFSSVMESLGATGALIPIDAGISSFTVTLRIDDPEITQRVVEKIGVALGLIESDAAADRFAELEIDISSLTDLLEALEHHSVRLEIRTGGGAQLLLSPSLRSSAGRARQRLHERQLLDTADVPQADEIERVFRVLELKAEDVDVNPYTLGVVIRQVSYYQQAARLLGYLDEYNDLAAAGRQLVRLDHEDRLRTTAVQFEQSACGFAWLNWSGVRHLPEIVEESATQFLQEASLLGKSTAPRRAATLRAWHRALVPFHYRSARGK